MRSTLRVPCSYQGGKQRLAVQIAGILLDAASGEDCLFYDLCCGSGAVSIELINRGVSPDRITMLDLSSWGSFWAAVGGGAFRLDVFEQQLAQIPQDRRLVKEHMNKLSRMDPGDFEAEFYAILQACSFGGKQIWWDGDKWHNAFFRDYWEPTQTSVRRSPANPMQPGPEELHRRILRIVKRMVGVTGVRRDINEILDMAVPPGSIIYVDPPYMGTTHYGFDFDILKFAQELKARSTANIFVSEGHPLPGDAVELHLGGAKGGISGNRVGKRQEWLTRF